ncbi:MAG: hypothetical protein E7644_02560 [Ruminococcaceae bacterium]|nr:hypothetical protein [Oscillospiraceae bacterium]
MRPSREAASVRIRRPKIGELAHQAQGARIFAAGEYPANGMKKARASVLFQLNPPMAEEIHLRWMKSLRDEICLAAGYGGGFNFI